VEGSQNLNWQNNCLNCTYLKNVEHCIWQMHLSCLIFYSLVFRRGLGQNRKGLYNVLRYALELPRSQKCFKWPPVHKMCRKSPSIFKHKPQTQPCEHKETQRKHCGQWLPKWSICPTNWTENTEVNLNAYKFHLKLPYVQKFKFEACLLRLRVLFFYCWALGAHEWPLATFLAPWELLCFFLRTL
jgi:hypothetical protein